MKKKKSKKKEKKKEKCKLTCSIVRPMKFYALQLLQSIDSNTRRSPWVTLMCMSHPIQPNTLTRAMLIWTNYKNSEVLSPWLWHSTLPRCQLISLDRSQHLNSVVAKSELIFVNFSLPFRRKDFELDFTSERWHHVVHFYAPSTGELSNNHFHVVQRTSNYR